MYRRGISSLHPAFYYFLLHLLPPNIPGVCDNHILSYPPSSFVTPVFIFLCPAYLIGTAYTSTLLLCPICHEWNMWFLIGPYLALSLCGVGRICSVLCRVVFCGSCIVGDIPPGRELGNHGYDYGKIRSGTMGGIGGSPMRRILDITQTSDIVKQHR